MGNSAQFKEYFMCYSTLNRIQVFRHYGAAFTSNDSAVLLYYGKTHCMVRLLE